MDAANQEDPSQYSKLFVSVLKPRVPLFGFLGLFFLSQEAIFGKPSIMDKPWPILRKRGEFFGILFKYYTLDFSHTQLQPLSATAVFQIFCFKVKTNSPLLCLFGPAGCVPGGNCLLSERVRTILIN